MKPTAFILMAGLCALLALPQTVLAYPDDYIGDTAIYGGQTATVKPNVMLVLDTSGSMGWNTDIEVCINIPDADGDGIADTSDNCVNTWNNDQLDTDGDGTGDLCDPTPLGGGTDPVVDTDGDGIPDGTDNCPLVANPGQEDADLTTPAGTACESTIVIGTGYDPTVSYDSQLFCGEWKSDDNRYEDMCTAQKFYKCKDFNSGTGLCDEYDKKGDFPTDMSDSSCTEVRDALAALGKYHGYLKVKDDGTCETKDDARRYMLGNYLNWYSASSGGTTIVSVPWSASNTSSVSALQSCTTQTEVKMVIAKKILTDLLNSTFGVNFGLMVFNGGDGGRLLTVDGYQTTIKDMDLEFTTGVTNRQKLISIISSIGTGGSTPLGETLFEAMRYYSGLTSASQSGVSYTSPISASCQDNYIVFISDGASTADDENYLKTIGNNGDVDGDGKEPNDLADSMDDVSKYLNTADLSVDGVPSGNIGHPGIQHATTFTIGFALDPNADAAAIQLLEDTSYNGGGKAYWAKDYQSLAGAFDAIIGRILDVDSSFVAPVVPTSPENRTYSGSRVYLGFFKPIPNSDWRGNLKKYGLNDNGDIVDKNNALATDVNGKFVVTSESFWTPTGSPDAGITDRGGVGGILKDRNLSTDPRLIYTKTSTGTSALTHTNNRFSKTNNAITAALLGVPGTPEVDKIIDYVHGIDVFDDDGDLSFVDNREWMLGDLLHFKPVIVDYASYTFNATNEANTAVNKTVVFTGTNDGMLHAFRDADGKELWSFIPPSVLPYMRNLHSTIHNYYVDASATIYRYDADNDGNIESGDGDKVVMIFGLRRGGGMDTLPATGSRGVYYALDVTNPLAPVLLWEVDNTTVDGSGNLMFEELGETWAEPTIGTVKIAGVKTVVAFVGAGYDNNEDLRFGNRQDFPSGTDDTTETTTLVNNGAGATTSAGGASQWHPKGRGIYAIQVATLSSSGAPTVATTPTKTWEYVYSSTRVSDNPTFSIPSDITALDTDFNGLTDRLYVGDTGGQMWRFRIGDSNIANWDAKIIFKSNPSDVTVSGENPATNGRKIFYPPSVVFEQGYYGIYFGTGDRPHPLNEAVMDRVYSVKDKGDTNIPFTEASLVNLTENFLQADSVTGAELAVANTNAGTTSTTLAELIADTDLALYNGEGWFIKLDLNSGEKMLSPPVVFNEVLYFSTYSPNIVTTDPCLAGNLGAALLYAVDYKNGQAVFNYDKGNDLETTLNNGRADIDGGVGRRSDRHVNIGSGIPSGVVIVIPQKGEPGGKIGCGGGLCKAPTKPKSLIFPIYWRQE